MADYNSSLPVRTENPGDVIVKLADATTPTQQVAVDASGKLFVKLADGAGNALTSTLSGGKQALDVNIASGSTSGAVPDESAFTYGTSDETPIGGVFQDTSPTLTAGQTGAVRLTSQRAFHVNLRTSAGVELGNSAADKLFVQSTDGTNSQVFTAAGEATVDVTSSAAFGSASGGTAGTSSELVGGIFNTALPTLTNGQQASIQLDSSGRLIIAPLSSSSTVTISNFPTTVDTNYGTVGANTIRTAAQIGNATGAADFNAGATGAQTLRVQANQGAPGTAANGWPVKPTDGTNSQSFTTAGSAKTDIEQIVGAAPGATNALPVQITNGTAFNGPTAPLFVTLADSVGTAIDNYQTSSALAAGSSVNQDYTVSAAKTFYSKQVWATATGKLKAQVEYETAAASGVFNTFWVGFNSTADTNILIPIPTSKTQVTGARIRIVLTNNDKAAMDVYSTLSGVEQ